LAHGDAEKSRESLEESRAADASGSGGGTYLNRRLGLFQEKKWPGAFSGLTQKGPRRGRKRGRQSYKLNRGHTEVGPGKGRAGSVRGNTPSGRISHRGGGSVPL